MDAYDEVFDERGHPRPGYAPVLAALVGHGPGRIASRVAEAAEQAGIRFVGAGGDESIHLDPVPRLIAGAEWRRLRDGLEQRARALHEFIADVYAGRRVVAAGVVPARAIESADHLEASLVGMDLGSPAAAVIGFDLVRGADGVLRVLEDNVRTPSGIAYALAVREVMDAALPPEILPPRMAPAGALEALRAVLDAARASAPDGKALLLSDGPANSAWFEHELLAPALGLELATAAQVERRDCRVLVDGEPVGLVYRRTDEDALRDARGEPTWLEETFGDALRAGAVRMVNAPGAGVGDDKLLHAYVEDMIRFYLGEEPVLRSVRTLDLGEESARAEALERLPELVVKPRSGYGGEGVVIAAEAGRGELDELADAIRRRPEDLVAQERVELSAHATVIGDALEPRRIDLRAFTAGDELLAAPLTRVAMSRGGMIVNSSRNGGVKDTWVLREGR